MDTVELQPYLMDTVELQPYLMDMVELQPNFGRSVFCIVCCFSILISRWLLEKEACWHREDNSTHGERALSVSDVGTFMAPWGVHKYTQLTSLGWQASDFGINDLSSKNML